MNALIFLLGALCGLSYGVWREISLRKQLQQILQVMETHTPEHISFPILSQLRRQVLINQDYQANLEVQLKSWQKLLENAPIGFLYLDIENQLLWCNEEAIELLDIQNWEASQLHLFLEIIPSFELDEIIQETRNQQVKRTIEWEFYPRSLAPIPVNPILLKATSLPLVNGEVAVFIENKQIIKTLAQARERWIADLSHELKTPLTSLRLIAETLQNKLEPPYSRWINQMLEQINRLINLVQDFLDLTHLESSPSQYINPQEIILESLIQQIWQSLDPFAQKKSIELVYSGESVKLWADINRLTQVFINLFDNALKYSPQGGKIYVTVTRNQGIIIDIYDQGKGFDLEDLPYVFDRLFRGDPSRQSQSDTPQDPSSMTRGSGLGLAIARRIILAHRGEITAQNHPQTGGAWLQIKLPEKWVTASPF